MQKQVTRFLIYILLGIGVLISIYPFYWMVTASTLKESDIFKVPIKWLPGSHFLENLSLLQASNPIFKALFNSLFVSGIVTIISVFLAALTGYVFAKFKFKGNKFLFILVLLTMMLPSQVTLVPLFIIIAKMNWLDSYLALIVPQLVTGFGIFFMRQQMLSFPNELIDSARIDGSGEFRIFLQIVLPTMKPACAALAIITFMNQWGNFIWPLIVMSSEEKYTLPLMLSMMVTPGNIVNYGAVMVGAVIGLVPIALLFLFFQKHFVKGIYSGSVKG